MPANNKVLRYQSQSPESLIIIFAREPVAGQVKTRLIPALGKEGASQLYCRLLDYAVNNALNSGLAAVNICITPESKSAYFKQQSYANSIEFSIQEGDDLGMRMQHALLFALQHYKTAILIGTDCPFLEKSDLQQAILALQTHDMVFSPASDGGYVLVGANKMDEMVFTNINWGSGDVMSQTRQALKASKLSWQELREQHDIDEPADLKYLARLGSFL